ncbi:MAG: replication and repair protein RecF protein [Candidatus Roizmanbacteria bacterium GW2011_GWA2_37_7]|uniref:DNA replication and repair protein RecF n=1 Tax=Candidatus Roizmanbacteria bacterium GW2011_GWA2_37_7 TaxID=1618481 RepID=A0A0G0HHE7_9BACT|nr:MAG: replication and repair protein RecF protein [Candidatus Roizmanbacteria bacterium GW2011_GWA2_37_7]
MSMILSKLQITNFRNFVSSSFEMSPHLTLIIGENAKGKTNLLEAVYTSMYGTGFRESKEAELIHWDYDDSIVDAQFLDGDIKQRFQVRLLKIGDERVQKKFFVNKAAKSLFQYRKNQMHAVLFAPEQIRIITGSPSRKRRYFDTVISCVDQGYKKSLRSYENALRRRNKVLELYDNELSLTQELSYWNGLIIEHGTELIRKRHSYIQFLNDHPHVDGKKFGIVYLPNIISMERIGQIRLQELRYRRTLIGPQKDDFTLFMKGEKEKNIGLYGSRSEQRMAVFWLKLNELAFFEKHTKEKPLLLLDDIFSELDARNRELVMKMIKAHQTIVTTTEKDIKNLVQMPEVVIEL